MPRAWGQRVHALHRRRGQPRQQRGLLSPRIAPIVGIQPAVSAEPPVHERFDGGQHLFGVERRQRTGPMKHRLAGFIGEDPIRHERVEVDVQIEGAAESLNHHDRTAAATLDAHVAGTIAQDPTDAPNHDASDGPAQVVVPRELVPQPVWHTQHPLPNRHVRKHAINEVRCAFGHPAAAATRAECTPFAREGDQPVESTAGGGHRTRGSRVGDR
jgi:hypothetical protein